MLNTAPTTPVDGQKLAAVVVTFHPERETISNLRLLKMQVPQIVVVDNGSAGESLEQLRLASHEVGFELLENGANLGIATALNRGVRWCLNHQLDWIILFDQDSSLTPGFIDAMFRGYAQHPQRDQVAVFCPRYTDRASGNPMPTPHLPDGSLEVARTSGSLMPRWIFERCGLFLDELFIDQVDFEYALRVRQKGYLLAECADANLLHSLGKPTVYKLFGRRLFGTTNHNPKRRYYLVRNRVFLVRHYWRAFPRWCAHIAFATVKETVKITCVEQFRWLKLRNTVLGLRDGLQGRMGLTQKM